MDVLKSDSFFIQTLGSLLQSNKGSKGIGRLSRKNSEREEWLILPYRLEGFVTEV